MVRMETPEAPAGTRRLMAWLVDLVFTQKPLLFLTGVALSAAVPVCHARIPSALSNWRSLKWLAEQSHCCQASCDTSLQVGQNQAMYEAVRAVTKLADMGSGETALPAQTCT